jgi:hypothetical protein
VDRVVVASQMGRVAVASVSAVVVGIIVITTTGITSPE